MALYDEDMLQEINDNVDLLEYVSNFIDLKQRGKEFFGKCSLHIDRTPSFSITPEKNRFFCFGCGAGGGIIQYLTIYEKMSFDEAVLKASNLANIDLKTMCQSETVKLNKSIKRRTLQKEENLELNVQQRILDKKEFLKHQKVPITDWINEGIRQEELDLFEVRLDTRGNRIVYPVYDTGGNLINIKGRTLCKDYKKLGIAKYINYFPVGVVDYFQGMNVTLPYISETGELKIFEGIKSVMKLFGWGIKDAASAEKHSLTPEQIKIIISSKEIKNVVFCYDSDVSYHEKDVKRNIDILKRFVNVYIIEDKGNLLGGALHKNSPVDLGLEVWNELYKSKTKIR